MNNSKAKSADGVLTAILLITALVYSISIIKYSTEVCDAIKNSIENCISAIIPSLFGLMAVSNIIISSGIYAVISKPFSLISRYVLKIPEEMFFVFLLGNFAGYPVGAKLLTDLVKSDRLTAKVAERMLCFCYAGGPAFVVAIAGTAIFSSVKIGLCFYISSVLANLCFAVISGFFCKIPRKALSKVKVCFSSQILINSVENTAKTLFRVCTMIVFFSIVVQLLDCSGVFSAIAEISRLDQNLIPFLKSLVEISNISTMRKFSYEYVSYICTAMSFGGFCIAFQVKSLISNAFSMKLFWISRLPIMALTVVIFKLISAKFLVDIIVTTSLKPNFVVEKHNFLATICLFFMIMLVIFQKRLEIQKEVCYNKSKEI